jgi:hypothetical protein
MFAPAGQYAAGLVAGNSKCPGWLSDQIRFTKEIGLWLFWLACTVSSLCEFSVIPPFLLVTVRPTTILVNIADAPRSRFSETSQPSRDRNALNKSPLAFLIARLRAAFDDQEPHYTELLRSWERIKWAFDRGLPFAMGHVVPIDEPRWNKRIDPKLEGNPSGGSMRLQGVKGQTILARTFDVPIASAANQRRGVLRGDHQ